MNWEAFITCAVTGAGNTVEASRKVPVTPREIADAAIEAARAGAAIAHIHVRDPVTGKGSRALHLYEEVIDIIRSSTVDVVLNLTAGMGGELVLGRGENPLPYDNEATDLAGPLERLAHVEKLLPEICTLDCGSMNFAAGGDFVMINTPEALMTKARRVRELGVRPELEVFDTGNLVFVHEMIRAGVLEEPFLIQLCMGVPYGVPADIGTFTAMVHQLPPQSTWSSFAIGRMQMPWVAATVLAGGHVRVGLEDNLYLRKGVTASNGELVSRAVELLERMGVGVLNPSEVRARLRLVKRR